MENDESKTLKYQMIYVGKIWNENLMRMDSNCRLFEDSIHKGHFIQKKEQPEIMFSEQFEDEDAF